MLPHRPMHRALLSVALALAAACGGDPGGPATDEADLATALDQLAREAGGDGDADAAAAFGSAAAAIRFGIRPTPIPVRVGDETSRYLAFVHVVGRAMADGQPVRIRTMVAWQGEGRPERILYLATFADQAELGRPAAPVAQRLDVRPPAWASWRDLEARELWVATSGTAGIAQTALGAPCPKVPEDAAVRCTAGRFDLRLDGEFQRVRDGRRGEPDPERRLPIAARATEVNGAVLVFPAR